jgi:hypothetical protein
MRNIKKPLGHNVKSFAYKINTLQYEKICKSQNFDKLPGNNDKEKVIYYLNTVYSKSCYELNISPNQQEPANPFPWITEVIIL